MTQVLYHLVWLRIHLEHQNKLKQTEKTVKSIHQVIFHYPSIISEYIMGSVLLVYLLYLLPGWGSHVLGGTQLTHLESTKHHNSIRLAST